MTVKKKIKILGYVWFPENTKERKKNAKENDFFMFGCPMKNINENQIYLKLIKNFIFKWFNLYNDELK